MQEWDMREERERKMTETKQPTQRQSCGVRVCVCVCVRVSVSVSMCVCGGGGSYRPYLFHLLHSFSSPLMAFPWGRRDSRNHKLYRQTLLCSHETQYTTATEAHTATALCRKSHTTASWCNASSKTAVDCLFIENTPLSKNMSYTDYISGFKDLFLTTILKSATSISTDSNW